ncbi:MAG: cytochrome c biogenesis protein ResB [Nitrospirae bacterium]|nr:cytochrome c biogenesis protein ResB [Nitrospirota bacterium]
MSNDQKNNGIFDKIWNLFSSIKLAVVVFSVISITSIVGTVIEQQAEPERNIKLLSKLFGDSFAPAAFHILDTLGFTDMFRSWWFLALLFIFASNLIVCSIERLPKILKVVREPIRPLAAEHLSALPIKKETVLKEQSGKVLEYASDILKRNGFRAAVRQEDGAVQLYGEKGRYSRVGVYVTHFSILLILAGAVIGMLFGFNASLQLMEGTASSVAYKSNGTTIPLGFQIRCDYFNADFYDNTDIPKAYRSRLTVLENGREIVKKEIDVNNPLRFKGITFYQASYGYAPGKDSVFEFKVTSKAGKKEDINVKFGETFTIPGTAVTGRVVDFSPALGADESGKLYTYSEMMNNPAAFVEFLERGAVKYRQWILVRYPQTWKVGDGIVEFTHLWGVQYTGLQVRKDPGVWIVYLGCLIMSVGLYASFFMNHARIWIQLKDEKGGTKVVIAGTANKNKLSFEHKIDKITNQLRVKGQR